MAISNKFIQNYFTYIVGTPIPTQHSVSEKVSFWEANPSVLAADAEKVMKATGKVQTPTKPTKEVPPAKAKAPKAPAFPTQVTSIAKSFGKVSNTGLNSWGDYDTDVGPDPMDDPEIGNLYAAVCRELKTKYMGTSTSKYGTKYQTYKTAAKKVRTTIYAVKDKEGFLNALLKHLNPNAPVGGFDWKAKVKPGEYVGLPVPKDPLTTKAMANMPTPENQAKADALKNKIAAYEAEIARLKDLQQAATRAKSKAEVSRDALGGMDEKLLKYFSYIEQNCSEYLSSVQATRKFLYRGQDDASQPIFVAYPRPDREPKDSDPEAQKIMDGYLQALGFKALRSNSIFTSADFSQASNYGNVFAIFPKNGFQFTWSTKHDDLVMDSASNFKDGDDAEDVADDYRDWQEELEQIIDYDFRDFIENHSKVFKIKNAYDEQTKVRDIEMKTRAMTEYKVMVKAYKAYERLDYYEDSAKDYHKQFLPMMASFKAFYAVYPYKWLTANSLKNLDKMMAKAQAALGKQETKNDKATAKRVVDEYGFTHENFPAALKSEHEVCVLGEYIAVNWDKYGDDIEKYFLGPKPKPEKKPVKKK